MPNVDGLKTGYYRKAGYSVVATAKKGGLRLIVVVLGSPKARARDNVAIEKFKKYFSQYTMVKVIKKGQVIDKEIILPQGKTMTLKGIADSEFLYPVAKDKRNSLKTVINLPEEIDGEIKKVVSGGTMERATPIAYAFINSDGSVASGTPNVSCTWNAGSQQYEITIAGESYFYNNYVTTVTVSGLARIATTNSGVGKLLVFIQEFYVISFGKVLTVRMKVWSLDGFAVRQQ